MLRLILISAASLLMSTSANALLLGAMLCVDCKIPAREVITQVDLNATAQFARANWPSDFQPNIDDVIDVCNGTRCVQQRYGATGWELARGWQGVSNTDPWAAANKNYLNIKKDSTGAGSGAVALMPAAYSDSGGGHWQIHQTGYWTVVTQTQGGVIIGQGTFYTLESMWFTFTPFDPNPREDMPMGTTPPPGEEF